MGVNLSLLADDSYSFLGYLPHKDPQCVHDNNRSQIAQILPVQFDTFWQKYRVEHDKILVSGHKWYRDGFGDQSVYTNLL